MHTVHQSLSRIAVAVACITAPQVLAQGPGAPALQDQATVPGGQSAEYSFEPLTAGTYQFFCSVHPGVPAMEGTLTVQ